MGISFPCPLFSLSLKPYVASLSIRRKAKGFLLPFHSSHPKSPLKSCLEHLHSLDVLYLEVLVVVLQRLLYLGNHHPHLLGWTAIAD